MRTITDAILSLQRFIAQDAICPAPWDVRTDLEVGAPPVRPFALIEAPTADATTGPPSQRMVTFAATVNLFLPKAASREAATDAALDLRAQVADAVDWGPDPYRTSGYIPLYAYEPRLAVQRVKIRGASGGTWRLRWNGVWTASISSAALAPAVQAPLNVLHPGGFQVQDRADGMFDVYFVGDLAGVAQPLLQLDDSALTWPAYPFAHPPTSVVAIQTAQPAPWRAPSDFLTVQSFGQTTVHDQGDETLAMVAVDLRLTFARARPVSSNRRILERISATAGIANGG